MPNGISRQYARCRRYLMRRDGIRRHCLFRFCAFFLLVSIRNRRNRFPRSYVICSLFLPEYIYIGCRANMMFSISQHYIRCNEGAFHDMHAFLRGSLYEEGELQPRARITAAAILLLLICSRGASPRSRQLTFRLLLGKKHLLLF